MEKGFQNLIVWQKGVKLATNIYKITNNFPKHEIYGLTSQIQRASISISSNIAEGYGRKGFGEYKQFLSYALGSCNELYTQIIISKNIGYLDDTVFNNLESNIQEISRILYTLITKESKYSQDKSNS